jgi:hypothetical protein
VKRITPSTMIAMLALFVALTGTGVAASQALAPPNTVGTQQIVNGSIRLVDLHASAREGMQGETGERGAAGVSGPPGPAGATGPIGATGPAGGFNPAKVSYAFASQSSIGPGSSGESTATCPSGSISIGGGGLSSVGKLGTSWAVPGGWRISVYNDTGITITIAAFVVCAAP